MAGGDGTKQVRRTLEGLEIFDPSTRRLVEGADIEERAVDLREFLDEIRRLKAGQGD